MDSSPSTSSSTPSSPSSSSSSSPSSSPSSIIGKSTPVLLFILLGTFLFTTENASSFNDILHHLPWVSHFIGGTSHSSSSLTSLPLHAWPRRFSDQFSLLKNAYTDSSSVPLYDYSVQHPSSVPSRTYALKKSLPYDKFSSVIDSMVTTTSSSSSSSIRSSSSSSSTVSFTVTSASSTVIDPRLMLLPLNLSSVGSHVQCERIPVVRNLRTFSIYGDHHRSLPRTLIAVTTCNYHKTTQRFLNYSEYNPDNTEIVLFDDFSSRYEELYRIALEYGAVAICRNTQRLGLISMLNVAWRFYKHNSRYRYMLLASNDIVIPVGSTQEMVRVFEKNSHVSLLIPLSTPAGLGGAAHSHYLHLNVLHWYPQLQQEYPNNAVEHPPDQASEMQAKITQYIDQRKNENLPEIIPVDKKKTFLAFIMGMTRDLSKYERPNEYKWDPAESQVVDYLWNSNLVTTGAESGLQNANVQPYVAVRSYVWHRKGSTAHDSMGPKRDSLDLSCNDENEQVRLRA